MYGLSAEKVAVSGSSTVLLPPIFAFRKGLREKGHEKGSSSWESKVQDTGDLRF